MMIDDNIKLSVCMTTYNHELYVKQAVDSVLTQKVNFNYELIIGDDASTDDTQKILSDNYGNDPRVTLILQKVNLYHKMDRPNNSYFVRERVKGKYVISIEGDDYWTDEDCLQKMSDWLDDHSECIGIAGHLLSLSEKQGIYWKQYDSDYDGRLLDYSDYAKEPGRSVDRIAIMFRNFYNDGLYDYSLYNICRYIGDLSSLIQIFLHGRVFQSDMIIGVHRDDRRHNSSNYNSIFSSKQTYIFHMQMIKKFPRMIDDSLDYNLLKDYYTKGYLSCFDTKREILEEFPFLISLIGIRDAIKYTSIYYRKALTQKAAIEKYKRLEREQIDKIKLLSYLDVNNNTIRDFFSVTNYSSVAIYGKGFIGERIINEIKNVGISIKYIIDKNAKHKYDHHIPIVYIDGDLESVDLIIITLLTDTKDIRKELSKRIHTDILDIESIVYGNWK